MIYRGEKCSSKEQLLDLRNYVNDKLAEKYGIISAVNDRVCFSLDTGEVLSITCMFGEGINALCTEYADNVDEMKKYATTDGDLYPLDDFPTPDLLIDAIIKEVEQY